MTRGIPRQEENQYLAVDREKMKKLPVEIQKVAGYSLSETFLGAQSTTAFLVINKEPRDSTTHIYIGYQVSLLILI